MDTQIITSKNNLGVLNRKNYGFSPLIVNNGGLQIRINHFEQTDRAYIVSLHIEELENDNISITKNSKGICVSVGVNKTYNLSNRISKSNSLLKLNTSYYVLHRAEIALPISEFSMENTIISYETKLVKLILRKEE